MTKLSVLGYPFTVSLSLLHRFSKIHKKVLNRIMVLLLNIFV